MSGPQSEQVVLGFFLLAIAAVGATALYAPPEYSDRAFRLAELWKRTSPPPPAAPGAAQAARRRGQPADR